MWPGLGCWAVLGASLADARKGLPLYDCADRVNKVRGLAPRGPARSTRRSKSAARSVRCARAAPTDSLERRAQIADCGRHDHGAVPSHQHT